MKFLKARPDRDGQVDWRGSDLPEGEVVNVQVGYTKGGTSYMTYKEIPRGIYVRLSETTIKDEGGFMCESFWIGNRGVWGSRSQSYHIKTISRLSAKKVAQVAEWVDPFAREIADLFRHGYMDEVKGYLFDVAKLAEAA